MLLPKGIVTNELIGNVTSFFSPVLQQISSITEDIWFDPAQGAIKRSNGNVLEGPKNPVVLIPGIISTGLEHYKGKECSKSYFRRRMWGTGNMLFAILTNRDCWLEHLKLGPDGLDPPGIKLRAALGLEAADYFISNFWIWSKIIDNLSYIGYDTNTLHFASYDWRLSYQNLEKRDHYFTKLKTWIELTKRITGKKVVIMSHSMGSNVFLYFLKWVESENGGNGGSRWVSDHLATFVNIAGPLLGTPKTVAALLSGEMRDTAQLGGVPAYLLENFFGRRQRSNLFWSWGGVASMLPKGGERIWGNLTWAPDDPPPPPSIPSHGSVVTVSYDPDSVDGYVPSQNYTTENVFDVLYEYGSPQGAKNVKSWYSYGIQTEDMLDSNKKIKKRFDDSRFWTNPLESTLPIVDKDSEFKIVCLYGVGKDTERSYYYAIDEDADETSTLKPAFSKILAQSKRDGTVPLLSLGFMCTRGWKHPRYNPSNIPIVTKEYVHKPIAGDIRGGRETADHVDILGNHEMIEDLLMIGSGWVGENGDGEVGDRILSNIEELSSRVDLD
ncbi:Lecithin:cholesterol acyltransferase-domain-containing protein [Paraphysoderma sedebokerense]|nr:Lecithin:cholesterol acyltransferase-domain-containing protein [Paraphysoderma sedebokerense]